MARVLAKVFSAVDNVALAAKVVNAVRNALCVDIFLGAGAKVFLLRHAQAVFDAGLEHLS